MNELKRLHPGAIFRQENGHLLEKCKLAYRERDHPGLIFERLADAARRPYFNPLFVMGSTGMLLRLGPGGYYIGEASFGDMRTLMVMTPKIQEQGYELAVADWKGWKRIVRRFDMTYRRYLPGEGYFWTRENH